MARRLAFEKATEEGCSRMWRSEDMVMIQFVMQREAAHDTVLRLGYLGMVQFLDLNVHQSAFQRDFAMDIRRCDEAERKLKYLEEEAKFAGLAPDEDVDFAATAPEPLSTLELKIDTKEADARQFAEQYASLNDELNATREHLEVLKHTRRGQEAVFLPASPLDKAAVTGPPTAPNGGLNMICGVLRKEKVHEFELLVYRATRGNSVIRKTEIEEPFVLSLTHEAQKKVAFSVFFGTSRLAEKLRRIAESQGAKIYSHAATVEEYRATCSVLEERMESLKVTKTRNITIRRETLKSVAEKIKDWQRAILTEKAVFGVMNLLTFAGPTVTGRGWCPLADVPDVKTCLEEAERMCGAQVGTVLEVIPTKDKRPTFFRTNKFTSIFQGIVESYGIGRYKEANPGVFTIITFPYLFGIMFGDMGHGVILTLFAAFLIFMEKKMESQRLNEMVAMVFGGRYLLFLMGLFATYIGILYNDMFGFSTEIFTSGYTWPELPPKGPSGLVHPNTPNGIPSVKPVSPVVFGIDGAWAETENKLEVYNSIKMKCAVIVGIVQMTVGIICSATNYAYYKDWKHMYFRFIPEIIFLTCTFGYMALMIIIKWLTPWDNTHDAPSLLETMTNFFLAPGYISTPLYAGQAGIQVTLLLIAVLQIPVLLLVIPILEKRHHDHQMLTRKASDSEMHPLTPEAHGHDHGHDHGHSHGGHDDVHDDEEEEAGGHGGHFDMSEIVIHQIIHTIEFVLGCVSNTASYLRLWALSLAHAQLSEVFWNFAFLMTVGLDQGSGVFIFIGFAIWLTATLGVLLGMESLSAFLHSLRLHWVEFNGKFYLGDGIKFSPFDIVSELEGKL